MTAQPYLILDDPFGTKREPGPFTSVKFQTNNVYLNGSATSCAYKDGTGWHITDGGAMGDAGLTGTTLPIILGQAK